MQGIVVKNICDQFDIWSDGKIYVNCFGRGNLKKGNKILVGDRVRFVYKDDKGVIDEIMPRKNELLRPKMANLDQLFIVVASEPIPDYELVDKLIVLCKYKKIVPYFVINKSDINDEEWSNQLINDYGRDVEDIFVTSNFTGEGIDELCKAMEGKISGFVGQSAVGKSCLLNSVCKIQKAEVGSLSKRTCRGKNTTRHYEITIIGNNTFVADTPGFSKLEIFDIKWTDLRLFYNDFQDFAPKCKYRSCVHTDTNLELCAVQRAVAEGLISRNRYDSYVRLCNKLKKYWEKKNG